MTDNLKELFLLDPQITFLNHGSFGACPRSVFETYQAWQLELERRPVEFLGRRITMLLAEARASLAAYLGAEADEVVYFPNPTTAINMVARNLKLQPGDEILTTDHEYGAMDRTWDYVCRLNGAHYVHHPIPLPVTTPAEFVEQFWAGVTPRTRAVFISHITSPTALIFPVAEICRRARVAGLLSIVDGAHAPGQLTLDLHALDADLYTGACHKWLCAPKGAAFLYARRPVQAWLDPLVVSWGYQSTTPSGSQFVDYHEWQGTRDLSAFLTVPAAIEFQAQHDWPAVRLRCHHLASQARERLHELTSLPTICPNTPEWFGQLFAARLPKNVDLDWLKPTLYDKYRIEVPLICWNDQKFIRVSIQGYNTLADIEALIYALTEILQQSTT
jgi:isopenicillin-N epimerase